MQHVPFLFINLTPTLLAFIEVSNSHGPSLQSTVCRSPLYNLTTITGPEARFKPAPPEKSEVDGEHVDCVYCTFNLYLLNGMSDSTMTDVMTTTILVMALLRDTQPKMAFSDQTTFLCLSLPLSLT